MKRIIELSENEYKILKEDGVQNHIALADTIIARSVPYEERPQGDLISREALKKALTSETRDIYEFVCLSRILEKIDNAPTVEAYTGTDLIEENKKGFNTARRLYERPHGEWTDLSTDGRHIGWIACSVCGQEPPSESNLRTNFCPNCGADMREEKE